MASGVWRDRQEVLAEVVDAGHLEILGIDSWRGSGAAAILEDELAGASI